MKENYKDKIREQNYFENKLYVQKEVSEDDALLQLTEELTECAQAILKYLRAKKGSNPTPVDIEKASWNIKEEFTDVILCSDVCCLKEDLDIKYEKMYRWKTRLEIMRGENGA